MWLNGGYLSDEAQEYQALAEQYRIARSDAERLAAEIVQLKIWNSDLTAQLKASSLSFAAARGREDGMEKIVLAAVAVAVVWNAFKKIDALEFADKAAKHILAEASMRADEALRVAVRAWREAQGGCEDKEL